MASNKKKTRLVMPGEGNMTPEEQDAVLDAFERMNKTTIAGFESEGELPTVTAAPSKAPIPLYGYYGDAFFGTKVSAELLEKEQKRFFKREDSQDDQIEEIEKGLCEKYGVMVPTKWPNRRKDRGTGGEQLLILGQTVNDRRHPKLWGIRQEDRTRHAYLLGPSGSGKATTLDTKILLERGWSNVGDVKIGDRVYGRDGKLANVTHIFEQPQQEVWEVEFADRQVVRCSAEHLWTIIYKNHGVRKEKTVPLWELEARGVVRQYEGSDNIEHPFSIPLCAPMDFPEADLPVHPYVLGVLLGDGCILEKRLPSLSSKDEDLAAMTSSCLGDDYDIVPTPSDKNCSWNIREKDENGKFGPAYKLREKLQALGVCHHSYDKFIPEAYKFSSIKQRRQLLQGLMDTDGTAHVGRFGYSTTSEHLRDDVVELARSLGYHVAYGIDYRPEKYPNSDGKCWDVSIHSNDYKNIFALERKRQDYLEYASNRSRMKEVFGYEPEEVSDDDRTVDPDLPLHPYLLGAFLRYSVARSNILTNQELDDEQRESLLGADPRLELRHQQNGKSTTPYIDGGKMKNGKHKNLVLYAFRDLGLDVKNTEKRIPHAYLNANFGTRLALFQGIADHNGNFAHRYWEFFSKNKGLVDDIEQLARSLGYTHCNRGIDQLGSHYVCVGISDTSMFTLPSRIEQASKFIKRNTADRESYNDDNKIVAIRKTGDVEPMRCFIVDNSSHTYIIDGYIVTHNSTLLHAIGVEDMWYWRGGLLMEPHGDLALSLLRTAPPYRLHDIVYLDVLDPQASPGFNPLELPINATDEQRQEATGTVTTLIAKHFNMDATHMPRLSKMLTNALNALSWVPGATILEIMDFYVNEDIRNTILSFVPDGPQKDAMADLAQTAKTEDLATLENRISRFTTNRFMRHLFGQSHTTLNFYQLMNEGKYIICPASKGGTSDDTFLKFYGSYIVSEVYKAAVMREAIEEGERVNFALTLDEFQNFMGDDIEGILAEARKYGLMMMLANQYLDQLTPPIRAAVLQNCATKLSYNLSPTDAKPMAQTFGYGLKPEDMQNIPKYHVMAAPLINGGNVRPFISAVFPPISLKSQVADITADLIREISRDKYMKNRNEIDAEINERKERLASGNKDSIRELMTKKNR